MASISAGNDLLGVRVVVVSVVFTVLSIMTVMGRFWARRIKKTHVELSDYLISVALFFTLCLNATITVAAITGASGRHQDSTTAAQTILLSKAFVAAGVLWAVAIMFVKLSILTFYIRLFHNKVFRNVTYSLMGLTVALAVTVTLTTLLICRPLAYNWDPTIGGTCGDTHNLYISGGIVNLLLDVSIVALPMPMLWGLKMKLSKRIALMAILGLGAIVCVISILRIVAINNLNLRDFPYTSASDGIWSLLEPNLGIAAANLPIVQPVLSKVSAITTALLSRSGATSQRSLRGSSRKWSEHHSDARNPEDMLYPLSNLATTVNEVDTDLSLFDTFAARLDHEERFDLQNSIQVKRAFNVTSEFRSE